MVLTQLLLPLVVRETKSIWVKTIEYPRSKAEGGWSHNVHLSRCSPAFNQELWRSALDLYCSSRWYFWKIVLCHRQTSEYTLSNEICFKFLTQLIKKLWPGKIGYFLRATLYSDNRKNTTSSNLWVSTFLSNFQSFPYPPSPEWSKTGAYQCTCSRSSSARRVWCPGHPECCCGWRGGGWSAWTRAAATAPEPGEWSVRHG